METINTSAEYVTLFINHANSLSQKAEAYVKTQHSFVNVIDVTKHHITPLQIIEIATKCNTPLSELFDRTTDFFQEKIKHTSSFADGDLANMLADNPLLMRTPFVVKGSTLKFYESANDLV